MNGSMNAGSEDRALGVVRYQIACLSCGYHRAWPTLLEAHADGHRHHTAPCATPALPAGSDHGGIDDERDQE
jgi:hypothetical protein